MNRIIALVSLIVILALVNWSILAKEKHLADGGIVYLELAPVDPRSLMQGDYMALRFRLANEVRRALPKKGVRKLRELAAADGYAVVSLDEQKVATFKQLYKKEELAEEELLLRYRVRNDKVKFATNAYFFQEGHGKYYESARYGQFRVDEKGELLLVAMFDDKLNELKPEENK